jgi:hypothetical protein
MPEYKTKAAEEVIGGQEQETPDNSDIFIYLFYFTLKTDLRSKQQ